MDKFEFKSKIKLASNSDRVNEVAKRIGIELPSTHTALFTSIFAKLTEANGNGVRLDASVGENIKQMIGSQINIGHRGHGYIVGILLDAWLEDNGEINIIFSFAKNVYDKEYTSALEKMAEDDLSVSFELLADQNDIEKLEDGTILLKKVDWQGCGFLIDEPPAYKNATVLSVATRLKSNAENCKELVFASKVIEQCDKILKTKNEGELSMTEEQMKIISELREELGDLVADVKDEDLLCEEVVSELRKEKELKANKEKEEVEASTSKPEEKKEEIQAEQKSIVKETYFTTVTYKDDGSEEIMSEKEVVRTWVDSEGNAQSETVRENTDVTYMYSSDEKAQAEAKIVELEANIKVLDEKLQASEKEVNVFKAKEEEEAKKALEAKIEAIKAELGENPYVKDFNQEDFLNEEKVEIAKIRKQNDDFKAENEVLKSKVKVEASIQDNDIPTGHSSEEEKPKSFREVVKGKLQK